MVIDHKELLDLLAQTALFSHLDEENLSRLVGLMRMTTYQRGETIFEAGDDSEVMFVISEGKIDLIAESGETFAKLQRGDFFGEEALLFDDPRFYQASAGTDVVLLWLSAENFLTVSENIFGVDDRLDVAVHSRRLSLQVDLPWLQKNEFVHVITRRHRAMLWIRALAPVILLISTLIFSPLILLEWLPGSLIGWIVLSLGLIGGVGWLVWRVIDWQNDYFIVTNKRVVWIEKVALIYESRQEAPLRTIMSVGLQQSWLGRVIGFADVIVMTYVGTVRLRDLKHAEVIGSLIESYWHRSDSDERFQESQIMAEKLHDKLGLPYGEDEDTQPMQVVSEQVREEGIPPAQVSEPGFLGWLFSDFLRLRYEAQGEIVYRKHWFVLVKTTWLPMLIAVGSLTGLVLRILGKLSMISWTGAVVGFLLALFLCLVWMIYQYADWRNDIFKVTWDQVIDMDRKPLGKVRRRSAPLENVLSIEYERLGFWGFLFNFGTVYISVGNTQLTFDHVYNPSEVQQDIFYRMGERLDRARQFEIEAERERMSEWIASYHRRNEALRQSRTQNGIED